MKIPLGPKWFVISYFVYNLFTFYQIKYAKDFEEINTKLITSSLFSYSPFMSFSRKFLVKHSSFLLSILSIFSFLYMIFEYSFFVYYGYKFYWLSAVILFVLGIWFNNLFFILETKMENGIFVMSVLGFVFIPLTVVGIIYFFPKYSP
jgi:hypothetical protein